MNSQYIEDDYSDCPYHSSHSVETVLSLMQNRNEKGENNEKGEIHQETSEEGLVLKELPSHLKYAYLESPKRKPVIISARLGDVEEQKLLEILKKHKESIAWSIEELKGINLHAQNSARRNFKAICRTSKEAESSDEGSSYEGSTQIAECWFYLCNFR